MYEQSLIQIGLSYPQAIIYEALVQNGPLKAKLVTQKTPFKRGLVYKALEELFSMDLVEKKEAKGEVTIFEAKHPLSLKKFAEKREKGATDARLALEGVISSIVSDYFLVSEKAGVIFYEGLDGIKKVLEDALNNNSKKEILTFSDVAGYSKYLADWNTKCYTPQRKKMGIHEKAIIPNNPLTLEYLKNYKSNDLTEFMFINHKIFPFATEINIYSDKVSFVTFSEKKLLGVIIENKEICDTLTSIFNMNWEIGKKYYKDIQPEWTKNFKKT
jgi:sugar-specific transcriptional regulator TrmB